MTNEPTGSSTADETPLTRLIVGHRYSAIQTFRRGRRGPRGYRAVTFQAGRETIEVSFAGGTNSPLQSRIMQRVWIKSLERYDNHPLLVVNGSIVPAEPTTDCSC